MIWSWVLSIIGILGFIYAGRHQWWAWLLLAANEILWIIYAVTTQQYGFILGAIGYITIHTINAHRWKHNDRRPTQPTQLRMSPPHPNPTILRRPRHRR